MERSTSCAGGPVVTYKVLGGTHSNTSAALNTGRMLLDFFRDPARGAASMQVAASGQSNVVPLPPLQVGPTPAPSNVVPVPPLQVGPTPAQRVVPLPPPVLPSVPPAPSPSDRRAEDEAACFRGAVGEENIAACSRLIAAGTLQGAELARVYVRRALLLVRRGEGDDDTRAIADASDGLRLEPNNPRALAIRAAGYIRLDDLDHALADLNEGNRIAPQDDGIRNGFGTYYHAKGQNDRALAAFDEALRLNPDNSSIYGNRALAYERSGELDKALADFREALRRDPQKREAVGREAAQGIARVEERLATSRAQPAPQVVTPVPPPVAPPTPAPGPGDRPASEPSRRVALVIGNSRYPDADPPLTQPAKHARLLADELRRSGYEVDVREDLSKQELRRAIEAFMGKIVPDSIALLFFSGYGLQADHQTYILPLDAQVWAEKDVVRDGIKLESLLRDMDDKGAAGKLVILDASRRNPYERRFRAAPAGLAPVTTPPGSLVIYAAAAGQVANDDAGVFVTELTKEIRTPAVTAEEAFIKTRIGVSNRTRAQQIPWISSSLTTDLKFARGGR